MPKSLRSSPGRATPELILEAAGPIFARHGFHATTVRQITHAAGVNIAAINYHFRDKQELYVNVLKKAHQAAARTAEADFAGTSRERLRAFIRTFLSYLLDPKRPEWHGELIAREMSQPTQALDRLVEESILPVKKRIYGIVKELAGPGVLEASLRMACFSVIGQCLYYVHCREMIARLFPQGKRSTRDIAALAEHIFRFSEAGLKTLRRDHLKLKKSS
jgi:AcrR family transcriptional regulator